MIYALYQMICSMTLKFLFPRNAPHRVLRVFLQAVLVR